MKYIISIILTLALILGIIISFTHNKDIHNIKTAQIQKEYLTLHDTLIKLDSSKIKVKLIYKNRVDTILIKNKAYVDSAFDSTFKKDEEDTIKSEVFESQLKKALIANEKSLRDSALASISDTQVVMCTTKVNNIIKLTDTLLVDKAKDKLKIGAIGTGIGMLISGITCLLLLK